MFLIYGVLVMMIPGQGLSFTGNFQTFDWIIVVCLGFTSSCVQICRAKAAQYEEPAKLSAVQYLQSVIQLIFDIALFNTVFSIQQVIGIAIVLTAATFKWAAEVRKAFFKKPILV